MSTYSSNLYIELIGTGEQTGTWGSTTNNNFQYVFEEAIVGRATVAFSDANVTLTPVAATTNQTFRNVYLNCTGTNTATRSLIVPNINKNYIVENNTTGGFSILVTTAAGTGITVPNGVKAAVYVDGTNVVTAFNYLGSALTLASLTVTGATALNGTVALGDAAADNITVNGTITSNLIFTDNTYDIGASGATRPRNLYLAGNAVIAGSTTLSGGTANGVMYLNGSKQVTTGTSLVFDGLNFGLGITPNTAWASTGSMQFGGSGVGNTTNPFVASTDSQTLQIGSNTYWNGSVWKAAYSGSITAMRQDFSYNQIAWNYASAVAGGTTQSFVQGMTFGNTGNLEIGGTFALGRKLNVDSSDDGYTMSLLQIGAYNSGKTSGIVFPGYYDGTNITDLASIRGGKENTTSGDFGGKLAFYTRTNGGSDTERVRIASTGFVGINEINPTTLLSLASGTATTLGLSITPSGWNNAKHRLTVPTSGDTSVWSFNYSGSAVDFSGYATSSISVGNGNVVIATGSTNIAPIVRAKIDNNGRVGFGTQGTTGDRLIDASFQGATLDSGSNQFGLVLNPTYGTNVTATLFNLYTGPNLTAGTTLANVYNLYLEAINAAGSTVTGSKWGLYQAGSGDRNYFAGTVTVNSQINAQVASASVPSTTNTALYFIGAAASNTYYAGQYYSGATGHDVYMGMVPNSVSSSSDSWSLGTVQSGAFTNRLLMGSSGLINIPNNGLCVNNNSGLQYGSQLYVNGSVAARNGGVDGTFQDAFVAGYTSNFTEKNIIQTAVSSSAGGSGFRFQVSNGGGSSGVTTALDVLRSVINFYSGGSIVANIQSQGLYMSGANWIYWDKSGTRSWQMYCNQTNANLIISSGDGAGTINLVSSTVAINGNLTKGSGSFKIDHPLPEKTDTHHLVHSFIEGPQADLIYRGKVNLVGGTATVNIDTAAGMTEGTFVVLCRDVQCFTTNESDWTAVRGSVSGNILTIEAQDNTSTANISWMVIGERQDKHMYETGWTDNDGKVIVEPLKSE